MPPSTPPLRSRPTEWPDGTTALRLRQHGAFLCLFVLIMLLGSIRPVRADYNWNEIEADNSLLTQTTSSSGLQGSVNLGYLATSGNSVLRSLNAKVLMGYRVGSWRTDLNLNWIQASAAGVLSDQSEEASSQTDYDFNSHNYTFLYLDYLDAPFSGYLRRYTEVVGYGRRLIAIPGQFLDAEIGVGARQTRPTTGPSRSSAIERLALNYRWRISHTSSLVEGLSLARGTTNTFSESNTSLILHVAGDLALSASYTISHDSTVPVGFLKTNTETSVSLIYSFN